MRRSLLIPMVLFAWSTCIHAAESLTLFDRAGLESQTSAIARQIRDAFDANTVAAADPASRHLQQAIQLTIGSAFNPATCRQHMLSAIEDWTDRRDRRAALDWLESPLGRRLTAAELSANAAELRDFQAFADELQTRPPAPERLALLADLDAALGSTEAGARLLMQLDTAVNMASWIGTESPESSYPQRDLDDYRSRMADHVSLHQLFTYQHFSQRELQQYIAFATSAAGARYLFAVQRGFEDAIEHGTWQLARLLSRFEHAPQLWHAALNYREKPRL